MCAFGLGFGLSRQETRPVVESLGTVKHPQNVAYAQSLDRGYADLAKKVMPGVVNISTYVRPKMMGPRFGQQFGQMGPGGRGDLFQKFFEDFFGGRMPAPRDTGPQDEEESEPQPKGKTGRKVQMALGTGFIIDEKEGLILTNHHVIQGSEEVRVQFKEDDSEHAPAEVIGRDPELDVALLKVKNGKLTALPLGDSDQIEVGEYVLAVGNPLGYGHTVSHGILSAKGRINPEFRMGKYLQTDASINPGNSGGPLINMRGEVIGINNAIDARAQGIGFAIPINLVKSILGQLKSKGSVSRGFLGVSVGDLTPELAEQMKLDPKIRGVVISDLTPGAPAVGAGLRPYDVILSVNGEKVENAQDLTSKITAIAVGSKAKIAYLRGGKQQEVTVQVSERPLLGQEAGGKPGKGAKAARSTYEELGFRAGEVTQANSRQFGIPTEALKAKNRVVVTDLEFGKPAAESGLARGDLILDIAGETVETVADLDRILKRLKDKSVMMRVKRFDMAGNDFVALIVLSR
jgi:serine protease Do